MDWCAARLPVTLGVNGAKATNMVWQGNVVLKHNRNLTNLRWYTIIWISLVCAENQASAPRKRPKIVGPCKGRTKGKPVDTVMEYVKGLYETYEGCPLPYSQQP